MRRFTRIPFLFCVGGAFALYARCVLFSYIGLDDAAYTFRNPFVAGGLSVPNVVEAFINLRHGGIWMPVTSISYMFDASLCRWTGLPLLGEMHLVNVLLHTANFILLWKLIGKIFGCAALGRTHETAESLQFGTRNHLSPILAALAAMIWAVHPLRAEPVAWIAARKELLWTLFALCGLIWGIAGWGKGMREEGRGETRNAKLSTIIYQLSTIISCVLACLSKPTAMCFPFLLLLVMWWMRKEEDRRAGGHRSPAANDQRSTINYQLIPLFLLAAATAAIAAYSQTHVAGREAVALYAAPVSHRCVQALSAIGYYIRATVWPFGLHADCRAVSGFWPLDAGWNFAALAIAAVVALAVLFVKRKMGGERVGEWVSEGVRDASSISTRSTRSTRLIIFSTLWFLISLLPTLGIFGSFGMEAHADRFAYLPSMAFSFLLVALLDRDKRSTDLSPFPPSPLSAFMRPALIVIVVFSLLTFRQLSYWRDDLETHQRVLDCDPGHPRAMVHVADARCARLRDFDGGIALYRKALSLSGTVPAGGFDAVDVKARLAYALASRGGDSDFEEVKKLGAAVLQDVRQDRRGMMLDALGTAFMAEGDSLRAAQLFKASIEAPDRFWPKSITQRKLDLLRRTQR